MRKLFALVFATVLLCGCTGLQFREASRPSIAGKRPELLLERFNNSLADRVNSFNSVIFDFAGQKFLALGFIEIDRREKSFRVVCLNPMGVKLFDLSGDESRTVTNYAIEPLAKYRQIGEAVAADIRRIYFDLLPPVDALQFPDEYRVVFGSGTPKGYLERIFAGEEGDLVEKRFYNADRIISWRVTYRNFDVREGKRQPREILLTNYQDGYQLTVREKEQSVAKDQE